MITRTPLEADAENQERVTSVKIRSASSWDLTARPGPRPPLSAAAGTAAPQPERRRSLPPSQEEKRPPPAANRPAQNPMVRARAPWPHHFSTPHFHPRRQASSLSHATNPVTSVPAEAPFPAVAAFMGRDRPYPNLKYRSALLSQTRPHISCDLGRGRSLSPREAQPFYPEFRNRGDGVEIRIDGDQGGLGARSEGVKR